MKYIFGLLLAVLAIPAMAGSADSYQENYRDSVIRNWQSRVADTDRCKPFKERFLSTGKRHLTAASAVFHTDMMAVWESAKKNGCAQQ